MIFLYSYERTHTMMHMNVRQCTLRLLSLFFPVLLYVSKCGWALSEIMMLHIFLAAFKN